MSEATRTVKVTPVSIDLNEMRETALTTHDEEARTKFSCLAVVKNKAGEEVTIEVIGTQKQWDMFDGSIEGRYAPRKDGTAAWFFAPSISFVAPVTDADAF